MEEREQLAEAILNHALEIICLLTVEDFIVVKRPPDGTRTTFSIRAAEVKRNICGTPTGYPELSFTLLGMADKTQKMIADLANRIARLLSKKLPAQHENVAAHFSKDDWKHLQGHSEQYENNQDICIIDQPLSLVRRSTEKSCPVKEELYEEPQPVAVKPAAPASVQQSAAKIYLITCPIKEELEEKPQRAAGFIPGNSEEKPLLPTVNVDRPFMEAQSSSGFSFVSSCDIGPVVGGESSDDTIDSEDEEQPTAPVQLSTRKSYQVPYRIKEELDEGPYPAPDGTSTLTSSGFIPGNPEEKPLLPPRSFAEAQTSSGFGFISSSDIKPELGGESSEETIDSEDEESPSQEDQEQLFNIIDDFKESEEENSDSYVPESVDMISTDEDYVPDDTDNKKPRKRKSRSGHKLSPPCEVCGKVFSSKSSLDKHLKIHTGERPFTCNDCGKSFSSKDHLTSHERSHSGERPYLCNKCGRRFFKHQHLRLHQVVHTGEKPYSCPVCGKGFTRQSSVVKHSGMHAEQKPFVCKDCGKSYCQYASLIVHQRVHSGEKPFICKHCDKAFACKATMLKHEISHTE